MMRITAIMLRTTTLIMFHTVVLADKLIKMLLVASSNFLLAPIFVFFDFARFFIGIQRFSLT